MTRMLKLRRRPTMLRKQTLLRKTKKRNPVTSPLAERIRKKRRKRSQQLGEIKRREVMTVVEVITPLILTDHLTSLSYFQGFERQGL